MRNLYICHIFMSICDIKIANYLRFSMPKLSLSNKEFLEFVKIKSVNDKAMFRNIQSILDELNSNNKDKVSKRTIYRKLVELRKENLIIESHHYYQLYIKKSPSIAKDILLIDENNQLINPELEENSLIIENVGEEKILVIEITEKGKKYLLHGEN